MLETLLKLGQQAGRNRGEWDDLLKPLNVATETKKGDPITSYCLPVRFDLDNQTVTVGDLVEYAGMDSVRRFFNLAVGGGNNPSVYVCVDGRKNLGQFTKTFFGKSAAAEKGELLNELGKYPGFPDTVLADVLQQIVPLRDAYMALVLNEKGEVALRKLTGEMKATDQVVLVYAEVKASALGLSDFTPFVQIVNEEMQALPGYAEFVKARFKKQIGNTRICYATGEEQSSVNTPLFPRTGSSLNRMFVTTTLHYAPLFSEDNYFLNYQIGEKTQQLLERGSDLLLSLYTTRIAGTKHCLIPQLLSTDSNPVESRLSKLSNKSDLLFQLRKVADSEDELSLDSDFYWITFLAFDTEGGKTFKTTNLISDVSQTYFTQLIIAFQKLDNSWRQAVYLPWQSVMGAFQFNLYTVYGLIPVRWDTQKKRPKDTRNAALLLFKQILERRPVSRRTLFGHFRDLILCHRYRRYGAFGNVYDNNLNDKLTAARAFDFAVRNAVYQYLAFFDILTHFHLLADMDESQTTPPKKEVTEPLKELSDYQQKVDAFLNRMNYSTSQRAVFFLGRALQKVAQAQADKEHKNMPIMTKLNYNGMDVKAIQRLCIDLHEKVRQYQLNKTEVVG